METPRPCTPALQAAVDEAYRVFGRYAAPPFPLDVCLGCCVSAQVEQQMRELPISRLTRSHFREYNGSARSEVQNPAEVGHFLPRMLELLASGEAMHHSLEIALERVGCCPSGCWTGAEQAVLDRFAAAYFDAALCGPFATRGFEDAFSVLLMFDIGGISIAPLLDAFQRCAHPLAVLQYVRARYWDFGPDGFYESAFAEDRQPFQQQLKSWLVDPQCQRAFRDKLLEPAFLALAAEQRDAGGAPFAMMVDAVFDRLTD